MCTKIPVTFHHCPTTTSNVKMPNERRCFPRFLQASSTSTAFFIQRWDSPRIGLYFYPFATESRLAAILLRHPPSPSGHPPSASAKNRKKLWLCSCMKHSTTASTILPVNNDGVITAAGSITSRRHQVVYDDIARTILLYRLDHKMYNLHITSFSTQKCFD